MRPFCMFSAMLVIASTLTVTQPASAEISITDLGTLGGDFSWATHINNRGQIVGDSMTVSGEFRAFLWTQGTGMTNIGTLGGPDSIASDINELGQVIGLSDTATQDCVSSLYGLPATIPLDCHSFFWTVDGGMMDIGTLGGASGVASDINDVGQVVGISETALGEFHAFRWSMGSGMTDLGTLGGPYSVAANINELGQVVGQSRTTSSALHAFFWENNVMTDLGTLGGSFSYAIDINALGEVVGISSISSSSTPANCFDFLASPPCHAFIWQNRTMIDLGTLGGAFSQPIVINELGQVAGISTTISGDVHAFLWDSGTGMLDLGTLSGPVSFANGINNLGQVVGTSQIAADATLCLFSLSFCHAFLWENGVMTDLGILPGGTGSSAGDINDSGQVAGVSTTASGRLRAVTWTVVNTPPVASFTFSPAAPIVSEVVTFDASGSSDPDGTIVSYSWEFGDATPTGSGQTATHSYSAAGTYTVALTVTDNGGLTASTSMTVTVLTPEQAIEQTVSDIQNLIDTGNLSDGQGRSLIAKLDSAKRLMDRGNACQTIHMLEIFISQVQREIDSGRLSLSDGQALIDEANRLIEDLRPSCSP